MSDPKGQKTPLPNQTTEARPEQRKASQPEAPAAEEAVKTTEALIRSLIVEERRRITPSLFPELEPAGDDDETQDDAAHETAPTRKTLNQSVRDTLSAERQVDEARRLHKQPGLLSRAFGAMRKTKNNAEESEGDY